MLRETLKQEIDRLDESQLRQIADLVASMRVGQASVPFWQRATPAERVERFQAWVEALPYSTHSLPDEAFDRGNIYD